MFKTVQPLHTPTTAAAYNVAVRKMGLNGEACDNLKKVFLILYTLSSQIYFDVV